MEKERSRFLEELKLDFPVIPLLSFMIATSFSPGPNNLTCASLGLEGGYKKAFPFVLGVYAGISLLLLISGILKLAAADLLNRYILIIRILGTIYLGWMAFGFLTKSGEIKKTAGSGNLFKGFFLQLMNPKSWLFVITIQGLFLIEAVDSIPKLISISFIIPIITIIATSSWALGGTFLSRFLKDPRKMKAFNICMGIFLLYTAISLWI